MIRFENVGLRYGLGPEVLKDVDFHLLGDDQIVDLTTDTATVEGLVGLTRSDGARVWGVVVDPSTPTEVTLTDLLDHILGVSTLLGAYRDLADHNGDGVVDAADVVHWINSL